MKEECKVYIKGVQGRGDEVIKTLTDLGAKNYVEFDGENTHAVYFITHDGNVGMTPCGNEIEEMLMEYCHEVKLPEKQWKDGDILIRKDNNNLFCVYQKPVDNGKGFLCHVYVSKDTLFTGVTVPAESADNYRKATDSEKFTFYALIGYHYVYWDEESKVLMLSPLKVYCEGSNECERIKKWRRIKSRL